MAHGVAEVDVDDLPPVSLELMLHHPVEVLVVDGVVAAQCGSVVVEHDGVVAMGSIVTAEVADECWQLPLVLHVERLQDVQPVADGLATDYPVDVGVVVHADAERGILYQVGVCKAAVDCPVGNGIADHGGLRVVRLEGIRCDAVVLEDGGVAEGVELVEIGRVVLVALLHGGVEAVTGDAESLAEDGRLERLRREVALHLADVFLPEELEVLEGGILLVVDGDRAHLVQRAVEPFQIVLQIGRYGLALLAELADALLRLPDLVDGALNGLDEFRVHLLTVVQEP